MTYKTYKDIIKEEDLSEDTIPVRQAILLGLLFFMAGFGMALLLTY